MTLIDRYLQGLRQVLPEASCAALELAQGADPAQLGALREAYPQVPASLLELLGRIDGTYWRDYQGTTICELILGSDVFEYPYYLLSVEQMLEERSYAESINDIYDGYLDEMPELIGAGVDPALAMNRRLCFSHCMNNGGTSKLYIDFDPAPGGSVGQVVRFLHDPDSYEVIAESFERYLERLIEDDYAFVFDDE
ncbi:MAG: hypothetical protein GAK45_01364 [Pseudomonas citronellolis]|nr:MAG: hypothetical protein GAK45_01364 [Pseudomonas citronellolis]